MDKKVVLVFDYEEFESVEAALRRARHIKLRLTDNRRIFVVDREVSWPPKEGEGEDGQQTE